MTPPHIPPDMESPQFDEDEIDAKTFLGCLSVLFIASVVIGATIMLAWRGLQCGV